MKPEKPILTCWVKATTREKGAPRLSLNWATSRRAPFRLFGDRIECGDWTIPVDAVREAVVHKSQIRLAPACVLVLRTDQEVYQFGFNPWCAIDRHLPFDYETVPIKLRYSMLSLVIRLALVGYLLYFIWSALT